MNGDSAAREHRRELRAERCAAVAHARAEQLGEERRLRAVHRGVREDEREDQRQPRRAAATPVSSSQNSG